MDWDTAYKLLNDVCSQVNANLQTHQAMQQALSVIRDEHNKFAALATLQNVPMQSDTVLPT